MGKSPPSSAAPRAPALSCSASPSFHPIVWGAGCGSLGAEEGLGPGPSATWPWLAPCPLCPPCPRVSGQDWPYMAEVRPMASMSPDVPGSTLTREESCSCGAPLRALGAPCAPQPRPPAPLPSALACDEFGRSQADPGDRFPILGIDSCCRGSRPCWGCSRVCEPGCEAVPARASIPVPSPLPWPHHGDFCFPQTASPEAGAGLWQPHGAAVGSGCPSLPQPLPARPGGCSQPLAGGVGAAAPDPSQAVSQGAFSVPRFAGVFLQRESPRVWLRAENHREGTEVGEDGGGGTPTQPLLKPRDAPRGSHRPLPGEEPGEASARRDADPRQQRKGGGPGADPHAVPQPPSPTEPPRKSLKHLPVPARTGTARPRRGMLRPNSWGMLRAGKPGLNKGKTRPKQRENPAQTKLCDGETRPKQSCAGETRPKAVLGKPKQRRAGAGPGRVRPPGPAAGAAVPCVPHHNAPWTGKAWFQNQRQNHGKELKHERGFSSLRSAGGSAAGRSTPRAREQQ
ncbi:hypothetical protein DV515_00016832 [Chloebia gouldiae]|uniref:Uncharacterized protein n=1 Tax=Chloebia gouldiae TaxID=44316 RepID=A0A3L8RAE8_CHLGU|nr:hypothetical protein DV515_00016832 [Chloebia gouldiae]